MPAETQEFTTYYMENSATVLRINIPKTWRLKVERSSYNGLNSVSFMDENGIVKASFDGILNIRDSSLPIQTLRAVYSPETAEMSGLEWSEVRDVTPINTQIISYMAQNRTGRRGSAAALLSSIYSTPMYDGPYFSEVDEEDDGF